MVVANVSRVATAAGHRVDVICADDPSASWLTDPESDLGTGFGSRAGRYMYSPSLRRWLGDHVGDYDLVVVHGIWQYQTRAVRSVCTRARVPYVVFVHGALDPWFGRRYPLKRVKKSFYWALGERRNLTPASAVLFTNDEECRLAGTAFRLQGMRCEVLPIGCPEPPVGEERQRAVFDAHFPELRGKDIVLFLGRLHPKKGCDLLVRAFAEVFGRDESVQLVLAGPDDGTQESLEALATECGVDRRITWAGMLSGEVKWGALRSAGVCVLPSHSENFGVVIAESLACGTPTLISDKVNIWRAIDRHGAGFVESDTVGGTATILRQWASLDADERAAMSARARECFEAEFSETVVADETIAMLRRAIGKVSA